MRAARTAGAPAVQRVLGRAYEGATKLLTDRRADLVRLSSALLERESLEREDLAAIRATASVAVSAPRSTVSSPAPGAPADH